MTADSIKGIGTGQGHVQAGAYRADMRNFRGAPVNPGYLAQVDGEYQFDLGAAHQVQGVGFDKHAPGADVACDTPAATGSGYRQVHRRQRLVPQIASSLGSLCHPVHPFFFPRIGEPIMHGIGNLLRASFHNNEEIRVFFSMPGSDPGAGHRPGVRTLSWYGLRAMRRKQDFTRFWLTRIIMPSTIAGLDSRRGTQAVNGGRL